MENTHKHFNVTGRLQIGFVDQNLWGHCNGGSESMEHFNAVNNLCDTLDNILKKCADE